MNSKKTINYFFENDILFYESLIKGFTEKNYIEFDEASKKIELSKKIDNLISGKIVNKSENQAALHPKYRSYAYNENAPKKIVDSKIKALEFFNKFCKKCRLESYESINIVMLGIGGSFEGPKLLLESLEK